MSVSLSCHEVGCGLCMSTLEMRPLRLLCAAQMCRASNAHATPSTSSSSSSPCDGSLLERSPGDQRRVHSGSSGGCQEEGCQAAGTIPGSQSENASRCERPQGGQEAVAVLRPTSTGTPAIKPVGRMDPLCNLRLPADVHAEEGRPGEHYGGGEWTDREGHVVSTPAVDGRRAANSTDLQAHDGQVDGRDCVEQGDRGGGKAKVATTGYPSPSTSTTTWEHLDPDTELIAAYENHHDQQQ